MAEKKTCKGKKAENAVNRVEILEETKTNSKIIIT